MPRLNKLSAPETAALEQPTIGARAQVAREYDSYLSGFVAGDYGRADLSDGDRRALVRSRLQAAARRRGLVLRFRHGPGAALIFRVELAPPPAAPLAPSTAAEQTVTLAPAPAAEQSEPRRRGAPAPQRQNRRPSAAERYHDMLPRWMRDGGGAPRPNRQGRRRPR